MSATAEKTLPLARLEAPSVALTPMDMLDRAVTSGASVETLEKLMGLQERYEKNNARKEFDAAVADAKAKIPPILRNKEGHNSKRYVDFAAIAKAVDPILSGLGLSYRFTTEQTDRINVTCVLSHRSGHFETTTLSGPADTTGNKNAIQAIGSTLTYLQRYSLVQMLGLAASDDDDGKAANASEKITEDQLTKLSSLADEVGADKIRFCKHMKIGALAEIPASRFQEAMDALETKRKPA